jgi:hypothetical protein
MVTIFGIKLLNRVNTATDFQSVITKYGCSVKTRIGLHEVADGVCSPSGVILLEFIGQDAEAFEKEVSALGDVIIQKMVF